MPLPVAVREVIEILLVHRFQKHCHCPLDYLVLELWYPDWPSLSFSLIEPYSLYRRCYILPIPHSLVQVAEVFVQVDGILLPRHPFQTRRSGLVDLPVRLLQEVIVHPVHQRGEHHSRIAGCQFRNLSKFC